MDFGDILNQWDNSRKKSRTTDSSRKGEGKKANADWIDKASAPPTQPAERKPQIPKMDDYLNHWLIMHGVQDKDKDGGGESDDRKSRIRESERIRNMRPQATLDLHGKTASEASAMVAEFLHSAGKSGLEKVLIIHGKGNHSSSEHIMTELVRKVLERNAMAGSFGPADREMGGRGATWVRIRKGFIFPDR